MTEKDTVMLSHALHSIWVSAALTMKAPARLRPLETTGKERDLHRMLWVAGLLLFGLVRVYLSCDWCGQSGDPFLVKYQIKNPIQRFKAVFFCFHYSRRVLPRICSPSRLHGRQMVSSHTELIDLCQCFGSQFSLLVIYCLYFTQLSNISPNIT